MKHLWENNKCLRCGLKREIRTFRVPLTYVPGYETRTRAVYIINNIRTSIRPNCFYPDQYQLNFNDKSKT